LAAEDFRNSVASMENNILSVTTGFWSAGLS